MKPHTKTYSFKHLSLPKHTTANFKHVSVHLKHTTVWHITAFKQISVHFKLTTVSHISVFEKITMDCPDNYW